MEISNNTWLLIIIGSCLIYVGFMSTFYPRKSISFHSGNVLYREDVFEKSKIDHYFSIELPEPGVTELSCLTTNFLYRWTQLHPKTQFHLYIVGHDRLQIPKTTFPNLRVQELESSLIFQTPLKWWLNEHVQWKYQTAMETIITFDHLNQSYNPSDYSIPMYKHLKLIYSILLLWHYGGTYVSTDIVLIKPITHLTSTNTITLVPRDSNRTGLDFLSISILRHRFINEFLIELSNSYEKQGIMKLDAEFLLSKVVHSWADTNDSIHLLSTNTFYGFDKQAMFANWSTTKDSSVRMTIWENDKHRHGIHFSITRVPQYIPPPMKNSLIDRLITLPRNLVSLKQISCFHSSIERIHMGQLIYQHMQHSDNNGDYVQAWASLQYYPCVDRFFERDNLHNLPSSNPTIFGQSTFRNDSHTPVSILMNAWWAFVHRESKQHQYWPPPNHFRPVYISMHIIPQMTKIMMTTKKTYREYGPVGARDRATLQSLKTYNISSWFSGCLTTTLKFQSFTKFPNKTKASIHIVDVHKNLLEFLVPPDILQNNVTWSSAIYTSPYVNKANEQLDDFNQVKKRFQQLLNSKLVLTGRLHVLLPCLALNIPVIFIYPSEAFHRDRRFQGLVDILVDHVYTEKDRYFWKNKSHPFFINWQNPTGINKNKREVLTKIITSLHKRLKQETEFRAWGQFYRVFD